MRDGQQHRITRVKRIAVHDYIIVGKNGHVSLKTLLLM
jgi:hypothetical protein